MNDRLRTLLALHALLAAQIVAGCSSAAYDEAYRKAVAAAVTRSEFAKLQPQAIEIAEGKLRLQPPKLLTDWLHEKAPDPMAKPKDGGEPAFVAPRRLFPPFLEGYPGFVAAYEGRFHVGNATLPATLSIGAVAPAVFTEPQLTTRFGEQLKRNEAFAKAANKWESRKVTDKNGAPRTWRVMRVHGPQPIDRWVAGLEESKPIDATCEIWLSDDRDQPFCTVLTWRVPDEIADKVKLDEIAPLVARSVVPGQ